MLSKLPIIFKEPSLVKQEGVISKCEKGSFLRRSNFAFDFGRMVPEEALLLIINNYKDTLLVSKNYSYYWSDIQKKSFFSKKIIYYHDMKNGVLMEISIEGDVVLPRSYIHSNSYKLFILSSVIFLLTASLLVYLFFRFKNISGSATFENYMQGR